MSLRVGDAAFVRTGLPAIVKERNADTGNITLETDLKTFQKDMRHGILNGIPEEQRPALYEILDGIKQQSKDPNERVAELSARLEELEKDPRNYLLSRYVKAELTHYMNTYGIRPKFYEVHESKIGG